MDSGTMIEESMSNTLAIVELNILQDKIVYNKNKTTKNYKIYV